MAFLSSVMTPLFLLDRLRQLDEFKAGLYSRYDLKKGHELDGANVYTNYRRVDDQKATWASATVTNEDGIREALEEHGNVDWSWQNRYPPAKCQSYMWCELLIVVFAGKEGRASFLAYTTTVKPAPDYDGLMPMPQHCEFGVTSFTPLPSSSSSSPSSSSSSTTTATTADLH
jgi:hypothetical protein